MKIAIVIYNYSEEGGGVERVASNLVRGLVEKGNEIHIFSHHVGPNVAFHSVNLHRVPVVTFYSAFKHSTFAANVKKMLQADSFDIIHSFSRTYYQDILRVGGGSHLEYIKRTNRLSSSPIGRFIIKLNPRERTILNLEKKSFQKDNYKKIVCVSKRCKEELIRNFSIPESDIVVIYNGVDTKRFNPKNKTLYRAKVRSAFGIDDGELVLVFVGSGYKRKGLANAIESIQLLPKEWQVKLLVLGRDNVSHYREMSQKLRIKDKIFFLGSRDNIWEYYAAADVLILPTLYDPFPNVCLEAMATGIPVVTTDITGVSEIITNGVDSFSVESGNDIVDIANKIKILYDKNTLNKMGMAARVTAEQYSIEKMVDANLSLYNEVLELKLSGQTLTK